MDSDVAGSACSKRDALMLALVAIASIVAQGLGAVAIVFGLGLIVDVVLTAMVTARLQRTRHRSPC